MFGRCLKRMTRASRSVLFEWGHNAVVADRSKHHTHPYLDKGSLGWTDGTYKDITLLSKLLDETLWRLTSSYIYFNF